MKTFPAETTAEFFDPYVGQAFVVRVGELAVTLKLVKVTAAPGSDPAQGPAPLALVFEGPLQPLLPQDTYELEHAQLGGNAVLIVPVGQGHSGTRYEAVLG